MKFYVLLLSLFGFTSAFAAEDLTKNLQVVVSDGKPQASAFFAHDADYAFYFSAMVKNRDISSTGHVTKIWYRLVDASGKSHTNWEILVNYGRQFTMSGDYGIQFALDSKKETVLPVLKGLKTLVVELSVDPEDSNVRATHRLEFADLCASHADLFVDVTTDKKGCSVAL